MKWISVVKDDIDFAVTTRAQKLQKGKCLDKTFQIRQCSEGKAQEDRKSLV